MRPALALAAVVLLALSLAAPHQHASALGSHGCAACVVRGAEPAEPATPDVAPRLVLASSAVPEPGEGPARGAPLGAVPGQSPPLA